MEPSHPVAAGIPHRHAVRGSNRRGTPRSRSIIQRRQRRPESAFYRILLGQFSAFCNAYLGHSYNRIEARGCAALSVTTAQSFARVTCSPIAAG